MTVNGAKRGATAAIALAFALAACQDGYPIAATRCDRWCKLSRVSECGFYSPANCVANCEATSGYSACNADLDVLLSCLEANASSIRCETWVDGKLEECEAEQTQVTDCGTAHLPSPASSGE